LFFFANSNSLTRIFATVFQSMFKPLLIHTLYYYSQEHQSSKKLMNQLEKALLFYQN